MYSDDNIDRSQAQDFPYTDCPVCGVEVASVAPHRQTPLQDRPKPAPAEGDCVFCCTCGAFLKFGHELMLVELTEDEFNALPEKMQDLFLDARTKFQEYQDNQ